MGNQGGIGTTAISHCGGKLLKYHAINIRTDCIIDLSPSQTGTGTSWGEIFAPGPIPYWPIPVTCHGSPFPCPSLVLAGCASWICTPPTICDQTLGPKSSCVGGRFRITLTFYTLFKGAWHNWDCFVMAVVVFIVGFMVWIMCVDNFKIYILSSTQWTQICYIRNTTNSPRRTLLAWMFRTWPLIGQVSTTMMFQHQGCGLTTRRSQKANLAT